MSLGLWYDGCRKFELCSLTHVYILVYFEALRYGVPFSLFFLMVFPPSGKIWFDYVLGWVILLSIWLARKTSLPVVPFVMSFFWHRATVNGMAICSFLLLFSGFSHAQRVNSVSSSAGAPSSATDGASPPATASPTLINNGTPTSFRSVFTIPSAVDIGASVSSCSFLFHASFSGLVFKSFFPSSRLSDFVAPLCGHL